MMCNARFDMMCSFNIEIIGEKNGREKEGVAEVEVLPLFLQHNIWLNLLNW